MQGAGSIECMPLYSSISSEVLNLLICASRKHSHQVLGATCLCTAVLLRALVRPCTQPEVWRQSMACTHGSAYKSSFFKVHTLCNISHVKSHRLISPAEGLAIDATALACPNTGGGSRWHAQRLTHRVFEVRCTLRHAGSRLRRWARVGEPGKPAANATAAAGGSNDEDQSIPTFCGPPAASCALPCLLSCRMASTACSLDYLTPLSWISACWLWGSR